MIWLRQSRRSSPIWPRIARSGLAACGTLLIGVTGALAQVGPLLCLPPEAPMTALPDTILSEYRDEISAEFEAYFSAVTAYIGCLDGERTRILEDARAATEAYATLLNTIPAVRITP